MQTSVNTSAGASNTSPAPSSLYVQPRVCRALSHITFQPQDGPIKHCCYRWHSGRLRCVCCIASWNRHLLVPPTTAQEEDERPTNRLGCRRQIPGIAFSAPHLDTIRISHYFSPTRGSLRLQRRPDAKSPCQQFPELASALIPRHHYCSKQHVLDVLARSDQLRPAVGGATVCDVQLPGRRAHHPPFTICASHSRKTAIGDGQHIR